MQKTNTMLRIMMKDFKVTSARFSIPDFNLVSRELENFTFKVLY